MRGKRLKYRKTKFGLLLSTVFFGLAISLSLIGLVSNSQNSKQLYDALIAVDESGGDVEAALNDLRTYIYSHMNTKIGSDLGVQPPIQLRGTYQRLVDAEAQRVKSKSGQVYSDAQTYCETTQPQGYYGKTRLGCIEEYIDGHSVITNSVEEDFYKFDFAAPVWSPDLAGISILFGIIFGFWFLVELIMFFRLRSLLKQ